ncbi:CheR family methyltransferase [Litoreibacter roseus]|uniref:Chemotaxis protein methyltransferase n=1 Tax=Litoreibacter roseus TaxID=2601869 RepID=A0A6N6JG74_9RHOB|nr:protein-glutamate O-methyltransferase [Litoreibacter roseus]GFE64810.1 chemotaxis protein methyltransferase [Litoreibacter roseus]
MRTAHTVKQDAAPKGFLYTDADFLRISRLAHSNYGLALQPTKKNLVYSRLTKRLRALNLNSFSAYCDYVESERGEEECKLLLGALTTNVTHFFRERHHFDYLTTELLPPLIAKARRGERVRIWSAGCSAGQEPYSIAFCLLDHCSDVQSLDIKVLGTDIDSTILDVAEIGEYPETECEAISAEQRRNYLTKTESGYSVGPVPRALISFAKLNLVDVWPMSGKFDVIFCRNVAIYFDKATQDRLWDRFHQQMVDGGTLLMGHSERLTPGTRRKFKNVGVTVYQKLAHGMAVEDEL